MSLTEVLKSISELKDRILILTKRVEELTKIIKEK